MTDIYEIAEYTLKALKNCGADAAQCIVDRSKKDELNVDGGKFSLPEISTYLAFGGLCIHFQLLPILMKNDLDLLFV